MADVEKIQLTCEEELQVEVMDYWIKTAPGVWLLEHHSVSRRFLGGVVETGKGYTGKASFAWHRTSGEQGESKTKAEAKREVEKYTNQKASHADD